MKALVEVSELVELYNTLQNLRDEVSILKEDIDSNDNTLVQYQAEISSLRKQLNERPIQEKVVEICKDGLCAKDIA